MLKGCLLLLAFVFTLLAVPPDYPDFSKCQEKITDAMLPTPVGDAIAIGSNRYLLFSPVAPNQFKIIRHDPFLQLYLIEADTNDHPLELWDNRPTKNPDKWMASISRQHVEKGQKTGWGTGIDQLATFSSETEPGSVMTGICYQIYGIGVGAKHYIETYYLDRFVKNEAVYYGDIGVRVQEKEGVVITSSDPFFPGNPFRVGDRIIKVQNQSIENVQEFYDLVINLPEGKRVGIEIKRYGQIKEFPVVVSRRYGGGYMTDTFLERFGVAVGKNLQVLKATPDSPNRFRWLKPGDRLLSINHQPVERYEDIQNLLSQTRREQVTFLMERDQFQFFIQVPTRWAQ